MCRRGLRIKKSRYREEQIIGILKQHEVGDLPVYVDPGESAWIVDTRLPVACDGHRQSLAGLLFSLLPHG